MRSLSLFVLLLAACHHAAPPKPSDGSKAAAEADTTRLANLLEERCVMCHDGQPNRPRFDQIKSLSRKDALQGVLMVSSGRMPPPPAALPEKDQRELIDALCRFGAKDPNRCNDFLAPASAQAYTRSPWDIQRILDSKLPYKDPKRAEHENEVLLGFPPSDRARQMTGAYLSAVVLMAYERCADLKDRAAIDTCVNTVINQEMVGLPPPVEGK